MTTDLLTGILIGLIGALIIEHVLVPLLGRIWGRYG
jgi:hypothetical protein